MFRWLKKLWKINRLRIAVMAAVPIFIWYFLTQGPSFLSNEISRYVFWILLAYMYIGTIILGIKFGPKVDVTFIGKGKNKRKKVTFVGKEYTFTFAFVMFAFFLGSFAMGLLMNGIDPIRGAFVYGSFLTYHTLCFVKNIPLSSFKVLAYVGDGSEGTGIAPYSVTSDPNMHRPSSVNSNTVYNNTYTFGGSASNYRH